MSTFTLGQGRFGRTRGITACAGRRLRQGCQRSQTGAALRFGLRVLDQRHMTDGALAAGAVGLVMRMRRDV
jgi:hypothetical protein